MSRNPYKLLRELIPEPALVVGDVIEYADGTATIELPGGGTIQARGIAAVTDRVFVRGDTIEGPAPTLTIELIDV